jgi:hypothetical protein
MAKVDGLPEGLPTVKDDQTPESDLTSISSSNLDALKAEVKPRLHAGQTAEDGPTPFRSSSVLSPQVAANEDQLGESPLPLEEVTTTSDYSPVPPMGGNQSGASPGPTIGEVSSASSLLPEASARTATNHYHHRRPDRRVRFIAGEKLENPIIIEEEEEGTSDDPIVL